MGPWISLAVLLLAGFAGLHPVPMGWVYLAGVLAFEGWLFGIVRSVGKAPVNAGEAPYLFTDDEARLVGRYRFYFTFPGISRHAASVLAAVGLTTLCLAPWLTYRGAFVPAAIAALNVIPVAWLTRRVAPLLTLGMQANRGNREALSLLSAHASAWEKIHRCNIDSSKDPGVSP
jgi:hypothetical protein